MSLWSILAVIGVAGAVGGAVNALLSDNGFLLPKLEDGIMRPGYIGNMFISAIAAVISWGLAGQFSNQLLDEPTPANGYHLPLGALAGALLVGVAGARWLTDEVDKKLLRAAAGEAAARSAVPAAGRTIMNATPAQALKIAKRLEA